MANSSDDDDDNYDNRSNNDYDCKIKFRNGKPTEDRSEKQFALFITFVSCYKCRGAFPFFAFFLKIGKKARSCFFFLFLLTQRSVPQQTNI